MVIIEGRRTVDLFQTRLFRNGGRCVFVERAPVAREVKLLVDIDVLIPEDLRRVCQITGTRLHAYHLHTTPRSATRSDLVGRRNAQ
jgi:hypothetical protein